MHLITRPKAQGQCHSASEKWTLRSFPVITNQNEPFFLSGSKCRKRSFSRDMFITWLAMQLFYIFKALNNLLFNFRRGLLYDIFLENTQNYDFFENIEKTFRK